MIQAQVIEGTPREIEDHLKTLNSGTRLTLIVPADSGQEEVLPNLYHATAEERAGALDEIAAMNRNLPLLPREALSRENLYEERF